MSRKHFDLKTKIKYAKICIIDGLEDATILFLYEFEQRYLDRWFELRKKKGRVTNPAHLAKQLIVVWTKKYNLLGEWGLMDMTGKKKGENRGRQKKVSINDLNEHDRALYQEIMEDILRDKGISPQIIQEKIKQKKKSGKQFQNHKGACDVLGVNRTSIYSIYKPTQKRDKFNVELKQVKGLKEWMLSEIAKSDNVVGRDKLYETYKNTNKSEISSYVWRLHWNSLKYKSRVYVRKNTDNPPKEKKYKGVYCADKIDFAYTSSFAHQKWFADISYLKLNNGWWYLHVITESFGNSIVAWSLSKERNSQATIKLLNQAFANTQTWPEIFHTDHGIEYANQYVTSFLENNGIIQSMSPKGNSLANRPSEFMFALIKREKLYQYDLAKMCHDQAIELISKYFHWYHNDRVQKNLEYKTPLAFLGQAEQNVMCLNFIS